MASSSSRSWRYNVFPSFHGPDVRVTFLSHLEKEFQHNGIITFNDEGIERSKPIGPELIQAIRESRISMVVLSENYASSSWCLNELVEILKCQESAGQIVMTLFYKVDPCDVRKQMGEFGKAFKKTCQGKRETEIESWVQALTQVANITGEHSLDWNDEAKMIEKIATDVLDKLNATRSRDFYELVGQVIHRQEPWKHHILIDPHEICDVLEYDRGTRTMFGISLDTSEIGEVFVSEGAFKRMPNLQFLSVHKRKQGENGRVCIPQDLEFPPRLRLLHWDAYPRKSLPGRFHLENLVELHMPNSQLEKLWEGPQPLTKLKKMDLSKSYQLKELPDLSNATNLEDLNLDDCTSLVEIPSSFSNLQKLKALSIYGCTKLEVIPAHMNLASLESIDMTACHSLRNFPDISKNISQLSISVKEIEQVPESIRLWSRLRVLAITSNVKLKLLTHLPQSVWHLQLSYLGAHRNSHIKKNIQWTQLYTKEN